YMDLLYILCCTIPCARAQSGPTFPLRKVYVDPRRNTSLASRELEYVRGSAATPRRIQLLRHEASILIEEAIACLVEPLRQLAARLAGDRHQPRPRCLRLAHFLGHRAPLALLACAAANRICGECLAETRGEILRRGGRGVLFRHEALDPCHELFHSLPAALDVELGATERIGIYREQPFHRADESAAERVGAMPHGGGRLVPARAQRAHPLEQIRGGGACVGALCREQRFQLHRERLAIRLPRFQLDLVAPLVAIEEMIGGAPEALPERLGLAAAHR